MKLGDYITKTQVADSTDAMGAGYEREHARLRDLLYGEIPSASPSCSPGGARSRDASWPPRSTSS